MTKTKPKTYEQTKAFFCPRKVSRVKCSLFEIQNEENYVPPVIHILKKMHRQFTAKSKNRFSGVRTDPAGRQRQSIIHLWYNININHSSYMFICPIFSQVSEAKNVHFNPWTPCNSLRPSTTPTQCPRNKYAEVLQMSTQ